LIYTFLNTTNADI